MPPAVLHMGCTADLLRAMQGRPALTVSEHGGPLLAAGGYLCWLQSPGAETQKGRCPRCGRCPSPACCLLPPAVNGLRQLPGHEMQDEGPVLHQR